MGGACHSFACPASFSLCNRLARFSAIILASSFFSAVSSTGRFYVGRKISLRMSAGGYVSERTRCVFSNGGNILSLY